MAATTATRSTWTDDDGSGTTGSIANNSELQKIYDAIDLLFSGTGAYTTVEFGGGVKVDALTTMAGGVIATQQTKSGTYTLVGTDYTIFATGTFTITLPTAVGRAGQMFVVKNIGTGVITVATTSAQTIDGSATYSLATQYQSITVQSDGSNWWVI